MHKALHIFGFLTLVLAIACGDKDPPPIPIFAEIPDPLNLVTLDIDGQEVQFASNHLVVLMKDGAGEAEAKAAAKTLGATLIGQIPSAGIYQFRVSSNSQHELEEFALQAEGLTGIQEVSYDVLGVTRDVSKCTANDDNDKITGRCALESLQYFQAVPIIEHFRQQIPFNKVKVAILDTGLTAIEQFGQTTPVDLQSINGVTMYDDADGHGTKVAGVIAADNDNGSVNGIATRILTPQNVEVFFCNGQTLGLTRMLSCAAIAGELNVDAVNMSFGYGQKSIRIPRFQSIQRKWERVFVQYPNTLYLASADNHPVELTRTNDAPAGIDLPNLLTVGGTGACKPNEPASFSARGPLIEIAAPAVNVPVIALDRPTGAPVYARGNSFATPIVTSIALVLRSLNPAITPAEIKKTLRDHAYPTSPEVNSARAVLAVPMLQAMIDAAVPADVLNTIDRDGDGIYDEPGMVVNRICARSQIEVEEEGIYTFEQDEEDQGAFINMLAWGLILVDEEHSLTATCQGCAFKLNQPYTIPTDLDLTLANNSPFLTGTAIGGSLTLNACVVVQRDGLLNLPLLLDVEGRTQGDLEVIKSSDPTIYTREFQGTFNLAMTVLATSATDGFINAIENSCHGGLRK